MCECSDTVGGSNDGRLGLGLTSDCEVIFYIPVCQEKINKGGRMQNMKQEYQTEEQKKRVAVLTLCKGI